MNEMKIDKKYQEEFVDVLKMIKLSSDNALKLVNFELINLYLNIGKHIDEKVEESDWGKSIVIELSSFISKKEHRFD